MIQVQLAREPAEMRDPVPVGTIGELRGVHGRYVWVLFAGIDTEQTMLPEDLINYYPQWGAR